MFIIRKALPHLTLIAGLLLSTALHADYLSDLEAEAQRIEDISASGDEEISNYTPNSPTDTSLHKDLNRTGFEANLHHSALGSYHVFKKLNSTHQEQVYADYQGGKSLRELRKLIRQLYRQQK